MPYPDLPGQSASLPLGWDCKVESLQDKERAGEEGKPKSQTEDTRILSRWAGTVNLNRRQGGREAGVIEKEVAPGTDCPGTNCPGKRTFPLSTPSRREKGRTAPERTAPGQFVPGQFVPFHACSVLTEETSVFRGNSFRGSPFREQPPFLLPPPPCLPAFCSSSQSQPNGTECACLRSVTLACLLRLRALYPVGFQLYSPSPTEVKPTVREGPGMAQILFNTLRLSSLDCRGNL